MQRLGNQIEFAQLKKKNLYLQTNFFSRPMGRGS